MKEVVNAQNIRLSYGIGTVRTWNYESFKKLFIENLIMYKFATTLIWGEYENHKLIKSFRYMDDGTFVNIEDEYIEIDENIKISLVHPMFFKRRNLKAEKPIIRL